MLFASQKKKFAGRQTFTAAQLRMVCIKGPKLTLILAMKKLCTMEVKQQQPSGGYNKGRYRAQRLTILTDDCTKVSHQITVLR